jgi:SAM-dependent methyltransferase
MTAEPLGGLSSEKAADIFSRELPLVDGVYLSGEASNSENELHTNQAFSEKWTTLQQDAADEEEGWKQFQFRWYLSCYGYETEVDFAASLSKRRVILDAGCGPGYKAAWFARMNPEATVVAMDLSDSIFVAASRYASLPNIMFVKGDIADTPFRDGTFDFISCDQVLHHTDSPPQTVQEFARILAAGGLLNTYVYARKSLPRELLDEHLREYAKQLTQEQIWDLSDQLTRLGRALAELNISLDVPDVPALGIKGGRQDLQRFIYWNFIKCFWNPEHGFEASKLINFDWYAPSTAFRYTLEEFTNMLSGAGFVPEFLHSEEACHSGRFHK